MGPDSISSEISLHRTTCGFQLFMNPPIRLCASVPWRLLMSDLICLSCNHNTLYIVDVGKASCSTEVLQEHTRLAAKDFIPMQDDVFIRIVSCIASTEVNKQLSDTCCRTAVRRRGSVHWIVIKNCDLPYLDALPTGLQDLGSQYLLRHSWKHDSLRCLLAWL